MSIPLDAMTSLADKAIASIPKVAKEVSDPEKAIVRRYLHALAQHRKLAARSANSKRRNARGGLGDRQAVRAAEWLKEAKRLHPLVVSIVGGKASAPAVECAPAVAPDAAPDASAGAAADLFDVEE